MWCTVGEHMYAMYAVYGCYQHTMSTQTHVFSPARVYGYIATLAYMRYGGGGHHSRSSPPPSAHSGR
jgi:hypothetical protein